MERARKILKFTAGGCRWHVRLHFFSCQRSVPIQHTRCCLACPFTLSFIFHLDFAFLLRTFSVRSTQFINEEACFNYSNFASIAMLIVHCDQWHETRRIVTFDLKYRHSFIHRTHSTLKLWACVCNNGVWK